MKTNVSSNALNALQIDSKHEYEFLSGSHSDYSSQEIYIPTKSEKEMLQINKKFAVWPNDGMNTNFLLVREKTLFVADRYPPIEAFVSKYSF